MPVTQGFIEGIDPDALKVVRRLLAVGHEAYLVGGCVRDLYLGRRPKDFDIATSATPETIRRLFRNSRVIGRRFKLAHVFFGSKIIEASTFRTAPQPSLDDDPLIVTDNEWGSVEDDARRRDFTINGLFFDVETESIVDFVDGMADLDARLIRTIGDPVVRFQEDPVRMIRAVKFAARLDFGFAPDTWEALLEVVPDIVKCSKARVVDEVFKLLRGGASMGSFALLLKTGLFDHVLAPYLRAYGPRDAARQQLLEALPEAGAPLGAADPTSAPQLLWRLLRALDNYITQTQEPVINAVLQALLFAPLVSQELQGSSRQELDRMLDAKMNPVGATLGLARRDRELARQILMTHHRMLDSGRGRRRHPSLAQRHNFHDALVFLGLWVEALGDGRGELERWQQLAATPPGPNDGAKNSRRRKRRGPRRGGRASDDNQDDAPGSEDQARPGES